jgi:hydroxyethylthiazole kinase-like uncharacterized protein yjeF
MTDFTTRLPRQLYRAAQVQALDRIALKDFDIAGFTLMQAAGAVTFNHLLEVWPQLQHLQIFVGSGNNGGDGYIVAGLAREHGLGVEVVAVADPQQLKGDSRAAWQWAGERDVATQAFADFVAEPHALHLHTVVVDALLGTGLDRAVEGEYRAAIDYINALDCPVLALDIPSGLSADTGAQLGAAVCADHTVTFIGMKQGLLTNRGRDFAGTILFSDLDIPAAVFSAASAPAPSAQRIDINFTSRILVPRTRSSHKGSHGHVVVLGGDYGYGGAGLMAAEAALRVGAGLVSLITRSAHRPAVLARRPEIMVLGTEDEGVQIAEQISRASVVVVGPGLGRGAWGQELMQLALSAQVAGNIPLLIDADGLHLLADRGAMAPLKRDNWILTPHPGEAAMLLDCAVSAVQDDRFAAVRAMYERWGGCCLLKGSGSLLCMADQQNATPASRDPQLWLSTEGNAGMATAGMGDVLSGIVAGLVAQGHSLQTSLCCGVCIHGEAADLAMEAEGQRGMVATDLFPFVRQLVNPSLAHSWS